MDWNPFKAADRVLDKGSNVFHKARNEFNDATRAVRRTASSAVNTARREIGETSQALRRTSNSFANTARREFNDTTRVVKKTTNSFANTARREIGETSQALRRTSNSFANTARREFSDTTRAVKKTTNIAVNTARREVGETSQALRRTSNSFASTARREFNDTTQAVRRTTNNVANIAHREFNDTTRAVRRTASSAVNIARREVGETSQALRRTSANFASTARREFNETTQAASRITNRAVNTVRQASWRDVGHTVLDGAGFIPVVGAVADVANGVWYAAEGNWTDAGFALGAAVPFAGDAVAAAKGATRIAEAANAVGRATNVAGIAEGGVNSVRSAAQGDWRNAGLSLGSTVLGGVNPARSARGVGTVANITGDAASAARRANSPRGGRVFNRTFRNQQANIIRSDESHPLRFLLDDKGRLPSDVHAGHQYPFSSGRREMLALEDSSLNSKDKTKPRRSVEIRGVPVERNTAEMWENKGLLPQGTISNAPSHPGWTRGVKIKPGAVDVVERHLAREIPRLREIAKTKGAPNWRSSKDREFYRLYTQTLRDVVQQRKQ